jgi:signal transduction histidine kinase
LPFFNVYHILHRVKNKFILSFYKILKKGYRRNGFVLRCLLCWGIGMLALSTDEKDNYDIRLQMRGSQDQIQNIVLININRSEVNVFFRKDFANHIRPLKELTDNSDNIFWNAQAWREILSKILAHDPLGIGVTFYFGENIADSLPVGEDKVIFQDSRITWMSYLYKGDHPLTPFFAVKDKTNVGFGELIRDDDGRVRSFYPISNNLYPHISVQLARKANAVPDDLHFENKRLINFRGTENAIKHYRLSELLTDQIPFGELRDKLVIIGEEGIDGTHFLTPIGPMSRAAITGHMTDNFMHKRWIKRLPYSFYAIELFLIMIFSVFLISKYPQTVALTFIIIFSGFISAFSIWLFDTFNVWTPAFSPLVQLGSTWILFVGYLVSKIERKNLYLEQERKTYSEFEQLKNNFISLISHDLKTPIAKIQAIVDRLLTSELSEPMLKDLTTLRGASLELHKYIQSILKVVRVESRDFRIFKEAADINELLVDALLKLKPLASEKNIEIFTQLEPLFSIEVDRTLIQEVFINLIENAIKYTPSNGIIEIRTIETENNIIIQIKDTGEGIGADEIETIFGKFVRGRNQDLKTKGTGLGLYLVKYFIEKHGGTIQLKSELKKGTEVMISLPTQTIEENN